MPGGGGGGTIPGGDAIIPGGGVGIPDGAIIPGGAIPGGAISGGVIPGGAIPGGGPIPGGGGGLYPSFPPSPAFGCGAIFIYLLSYPPNWTTRFITFQTTSKNQKSNSPQ